MEQKNRYIESDKTFDDRIYDYIIYTDGCYSRRHNIGAFAYVILDGEDNIIKSGSKKIENETNNRAELKEIMCGVYNLPDEAKEVCVVSDSQYALKTCSKVWGRNTNTDLFEWYDNYLKNKPLNITYKWVRGHSGNMWNELCDQMCNDAAGMDLNEEFEKYRKTNK